MSNRVIQEGPEKANVKPENNIPKPDVMPPAQGILGKNNENNENNEHKTAKELLEGMICPFCKHSDGLGFRFYDKEGEKVYEKALSCNVCSSIGPIAENPIEAIMMWRESEKAPEPSKSIILTP